jgi:hypothetical protein
MMRWNDFGRSVGFAAIAALAWPAFALAAQPLLGARAALALYLVAITALYVAGLAARRLHGAAAAMTVAAIGGAFAAVAHDPGAVALGAAVALGIARSGILYRARAGRALAVEALLLGGGLLLAHVVATPGVLGVALGLWTFFLVQSAFFAIAGSRERVATPPGVDRFDAARRRALALLDDGFGV